MTVSAGAPDLVARPQDYELIGPDGNGSGLDALGRPLPLVFPACGATSGLSPYGCSQNAGHDGPHHTVYGTTWDDTPAKRDDLDRPRPKAMSKGQLLVEIGRALHAAFPDRADEIVRALEERMPDSFALAESSRDGVEYYARILLEYDESDARWKATRTAARVGTVEHSGRMAVSERSRRTHGATIYVQVTDGDEP